MKRIALLSLVFLLSLSGGTIRCDSDDGILSGSEDYTVDDFVQAIEAGNTSLVEAIGKTANKIKKKKKLPSSWKKKTIAALEELKNSGEDVSSELIQTLYDLLNKESKVQELYAKFNFVTLLDPDNTADNIEALKGLASSKVDLFKNHKLSKAIRTEVGKALDKLKLAVSDGKEVSYKFVKALHDLLDQEDQVKELYATVANAHFTRLLDPDNIQDHLAELKEDLNQTLAVHFSTVKAFTPIKEKLVACGKAMKEHKIRLNVFAAIARLFHTDAETQTCFKAAKDHELADAIKHGNVQRVGEFKKEYFAEDEEIGGAAAAQWVEANAALKKLTEETINGKHNPDVLEAICGMFLKEKDQEAHKYFKDGNNYLYRMLAQEQAPDQTVATLWYTQHYRKELTDALDEDDIDEVRTTLAVFTNEHAGLRTHAIGLAIANIEKYITDAGLDEGNDYRTELEAEVAKLKELQPDAGDDDNTPDDTPAPEEEVKACGNLARYVACSAATAAAVFGMEYLYQKYFAPKKDSDEVERNVARTQCPCYACTHNVQPA